MDNVMRYHLNAKRPRPGASLDMLNAAEADRARRFHAGFPQYAPTPLIPLPYLASALGLGNIRVKDESRRFGLNAFKVLGASYAMGRPSMTAGQRISVVWKKHCRKQIRTGL